MINPRFEKLLGCLVRFLNFFGLAEPPKPGTTDSDPPVKEKKNE